MERYIDHALTLESAETLLTTGSPKRRNQTPNPKVKAVTTWRTIKKGSCASLGSGKSRRHPLPEKVLLYCSNCRGSGRDH